MGMFSHYDNPARAMRVWWDYREDFMERDLVKARMFLMSCKTADDLDIRLDVLFRKPVHITGNVRPSLNNIDEDSNGAYSNARRALEEGC